MIDKELQWLIRELAERPLFEPAEIRGGIEDQNRMYLINRAIEAARAADASLRRVFRHNTPGGAELRGNYVVKR